MIKSGGVVLFPTRCLYGLGADAFNTAAVARVFQIKQRPSGNPLLVLVKGRTDVDDLVKNIPADAVRIMNGLWPGRITLVFQATDALPPGLTAGTGKIGIRIPGHRVASQLVLATGRPITGTSANLSETPGASRISDVDPAIIEAVDLILDVGTLKGGSGSTVIDVSEDVPNILREGDVSAKELSDVLRAQRGNPLGKGKQNPINRAL